MIIVLLALIHSQENEHVHLCITISVEVFYDCEHSFFKCPLLIDNSIKKKQKLELNSLEKVMWEKLFHRKDQSRKQFHPRTVQFGRSPFKAM